MDYFWKVSHHKVTHPSALGSAGYSGPGLFPCSRKDSLRQAGVQFSICTKEGRAQQTVLRQFFPPWIYFFSFFKKSVFQVRKRTSNNISKWNWVDHHVVKSDIHSLLVFSGISVIMKKAILLLIGICLAIFNGVYANPPHQQLQLQCLPLTDCWVADLLGPGSLHPSEPLSDQYKCHPGSTCIIGGSRQPSDFSQVTEPATTISLCYCLIPRPASPMQPSLSKAVYYGFFFLICTLVQKFLPTL